MIPNPRRTVAHGTPRHSSEYIKEERWEPFSEKRCETLIHDDSVDERNDGEPVVIAIARSDTSNGRHEHFVLRGIPAIAELCDHNFQLAANHA